VWFVVLQCVFLSVIFSPLHLNFGSTQSSTRSENIIALWNELSCFEVLIVVIVRTWSLSACTSISRQTLSVLFCLMIASYVHLTTSEVWCWSGGKGILKKLSLCYSIVYYYNGAQRYEQLLQVGRLYRALILLGLALCFPSASVSLIFTVLYGTIYILILKNFCLHPSLYF